MRNPGTNQRASEKLGEAKVNTFILSELHLGLALDNRHGGIVMGPRAISQLTDYVRYTEYHRGSGAIALAISW